MPLESINTEPTSSFATPLEWLKNCWKKDHYRRAGLISLPISAAFLICLLALDMPFSEWFFDLLFSASFIGTFLSGSTYIARPLDKESRSAEKIGTVIFTIIGIIVTGLICAAAKTAKKAIPFADVLSDLAYAIFAIGNISTFAGLGNRLGSCVNEEIPINERASRISGAVIGAVAGAILWIFAKTALVALITGGIFLPGGACVLPAILGAAVITSNISSTTASACDYLSKSYNYAKYTCGFKCDETVEKRITEHPHEYRGSAVGVGLGIAIGITVAILMPHVAAGIIGLAITGLVITACCSILGGLCSRIGRVIDGGTKNSVTPPKVSPTPSKKTSLVATPALDTKRPIVFPSLFSPPPKNTPDINNIPALMPSGWHSPSPCNN